MKNKSEFLSSTDESSREINGWQSHLCEIKLCKVWRGKSDGREECMVVSDALGADAIGERRTAKLRATRRMRFWWLGQSIGGMRGTGCTARQPVLKVNKDSLSLWALDVSCLVCGAIVVVVGFIFSAMAAHLKDRHLFGLSCCSDTVTCAVATHHGILNHFNWYIRTTVPSTASLATSFFNITSLVPHLPLHVERVIHCDPRPLDHMSHGCEKASGSKDSLD